MAVLGELVERDVRVAPARREGTNRAIAPPFVAEPMGGLLSRLVEPLPRFLLLPQPPESQGDHLAVSGIPPLFRRPLGVPVSNRGAHVFGQFADEPPAGHGQIDKVFQVHFSQVPATGSNPLEGFPEATLADEGTDVG